MASCHVLFCVIFSYRIHTRLTLDCLISCCWTEGRTRLAQSQKRRCRVADGRGCDNSPGSVVGGHDRQHAGAGGHERWKCRKLLPRFVRERCSQVSLVGRCCPRARSPFPDGSQAVANICLVLGWCFDVMPCTIAWRCCVDSSNTSRSYFREQRFVCQAWTEQLQLPCNESVAREDQVTKLTANGNVDESRALSQL